MTHIPFFHIIITGSDDETDLDYDLFFLPISSVRIHGQRKNSYKDNNGHIVCLTFKQKKRDKETERKVKQRF